VSGWIVDVNEWRGSRDVKLRSESWREEIVIDDGGEFSVSAKVDGNACDTSFSVPMAKLVEFFFAVGWTLEPRDEP
jgi:hypothetical protein